MTEALAPLRDDHEFLLQGGVFTEDLIEAWIDYKTAHEVDPVRPSGCPTWKPLCASAEERGGSCIIGPYQEPGSDLVVGLFADLEGHVIGVANVT